MDCNLYVTFIKVGLSALEIFGGESIISLNVWWREMPFHKISMEVDLIFNIYIYITLKKRKLYVTNQIHCCGPCGPVEAYCQNSGRNFF